MRFIDARSMGGSWLGEGWGEEGRVVANLLPSLKERAERKGGEIGPIDVGCAAHPWDLTRLFRRVYLVSPVGSWNPIRRCSCSVDGVRTQDIPYIRGRTTSGRKKPRLVCAACRSRRGGERPKHIWKSTLLI